MLPIGAVLSRARRLYGGQEAVADEDGWITYERLGSRVDALSSAFAQSGLGRGDRVAILDVNSRQYLEVYYATAQSGITLVPLNSRLSPPEIEFILRDCEARALVVSHPFVDLATSIRDRLPTLELLFCYGARSLPSRVLDYETILAAAPQLNPYPPIDPSDLAQIYYTSGTTGHPKGVCLTYDNMAYSMVDAIVGLGLTHRDNWLHTAPLFHLVDAWSVWAVPLMGARQSVVHFDPDTVLRFIEQTKATASGLPPTLIGMIANHGRLADFDISSMRLAIYGGSPMPEAVLRQALDKLPFDLVHGYGITETSGITTVLRPSSRAEALLRARSAGQRVPSIRLEIRDDNGRALGVGDVGEIVVRGPRVMKGYWSNEAETQRVLVDGTYYTGDLGYLDSDDNLTIVDRKKDMIISGGENVYSAEVESLLSSHPQVAEVAVIGIPSEKWGEQVHAIIHARRGTELDARQIVEWCRGKLAGYKIPKSISFTPEPLPRTGPGKIAKRRLRETFWEGRSNKI
ncbi:long-chain-fatty-acid--CoA ligase [Bradyrhizobium sp. ma5]|uniref:long-chain-fatty-acid--CoA ligase n=1 Tax=Bradyrhizobium sp. ma5 TaxID=3344828 RepID=UPI0035D4A5CA